MSDILQIILAYVLLGLSTSITAYPKLIRKDKKWIWVIFLIWPFWWIVIIIN